MGCRFASTVFLHAVVGADSTADYYNYEPGSTLDHGGPGSVDANGTHQAPSPAEKPSQPPFLCDMHYNVSRLQTDTGPIVR